MSQYSEFNAGVAWANDVLEKLLRVDEFRQKEDYESWYDELESTYLSIYPVLSLAETKKAENLLEEASAAVRRHRYVGAVRSVRGAMIDAEKYVRSLVGVHDILTRFKQDTRGETGRMS